VARWLRISPASEHIVARSSPTNRPSWPSTVTGRDLQGSDLTDIHRRNAVSPPSCPFAAPSARYSINPTAHTGEPAAVVPLLRFTRCPLHCLNSEYPLPQHRNGATSGNLLRHRPLSFQLRGFSPPCWLTPLATAQAYCILHPVLRFEHFPTSRSRASKLARGTVVFPYPQTPLEESPHSTPYRITAACPFMALCRPINTHCASIHSRVVQCLLRGASRGHRASTKLRLP